MAYFGAMISKNQIKRIVSLQQKKYRQIHQRFVVEGEKMVSLLFASRGWALRFFYLIVSIMATIANFKEGIKAFSRIA